MPYATFGYDIDLQRYETLSRKFGVPVVVDAAASLGTVSRDGHGFGTGFSGAVVFSMHATKSFATGEGGIIYSGDDKLVATMRTMCNFGFGLPRNATMPGINAKLSEVGALTGELRLRDYDYIVQRRSDLVSLYRAELPEFGFQPTGPNRQAHQFASSLLPHEYAHHRSAIQAGLATRGIGTAAYFSPHLAQQDYFKANAKAAQVDVCDDVAARVFSMPLFDGMTEKDVRYVIHALREELAIRDPKPLMANVQASFPTGIPINVSTPWELTMFEAGALAKGTALHVKAEASVGL